MRSIHFKMLIGKWKKIHKSSHFEIDLFLPDYPFNQPKNRLETRRYHCNIKDKSDISAVIPKDNCSHALIISQVLLTLHKSNRRSKSCSRTAKLY